MKKCKAVRGILLAENTNEVLLTRVLVPDTGLCHWITPGGGMDDGETEKECLFRELREETGYGGAVGEVAVWNRSCVFTFAGVVHQQEEIYFLVKTAKFAPINLNFADDAERKALKEFRWWSVEEIIESSESFIPDDLGFHLKALISDGVPERVINITPKNF